MITVIAGFVTARLREPHYAISHLTKGDLPVPLLLGVCVLWYVSTITTNFNK